MNAILEPSQIFPHPLPTQYSETHSTRPIMLRTFSCGIPLPLFIILTQNISFVQHRLSVQFTTNIANIYIRASCNSEGAALWDCGVLRGRRLRIDNIIFRLSTVGTIGIIISLLRSFTFFTFFRWCTIFERSPIYSIWDVWEHINCFCCISWIFNEHINYYQNHKCS